MSENRSVSVRVNVTPAERQALERLAERDDVSIAWHVRRAIKAYLENELKPKGRRRRNA